MNPTPPQRLPVQTILRRHQPRHITLPCGDCAHLLGHRRGQRLGRLPALQAQRAPETIPTFSLRERLAAHYARALSLTPPLLEPELIAALRAHFTEREIVILATTVAQVNYWARLCQGLGVPPAGFTDYCTVPASITSP